MEFNPTSELWDCSTHKARDTHFRAYLRTRYVEENYLCWIALTELIEFIRRQALDRVDLRNDKFFLLYDTYVDPASPSSISFPLALQVRAKKLMTALRVSPEDSVFDIRLLYEMLKEVEMLLQTDLKSFCLKYPFQRGEAPLEMEDTDERESCSAQIMVRRTLHVDSPKKMRKSLSAKPFSDRRRKLVHSGVNILVMHVNPTRGTKFVLPISKIQQRISRKPTVIVMQCGDQEFTVRFKSAKERDKWERIIMDEKLEMLSEDTRRRAQRRAILNAPQRLALEGQFDTSAGLFVSPPAYNRSEGSSVSSLDLLPKKMKVKRASPRLGASAFTLPQMSATFECTKVSTLTRTRNSSPNIFVREAVPLEEEEENAPVLCVSSSEEEDESTTMDDEEEESTSLDDDPSSPQTDTTAKDYHNMLHIELPHQMSEGSLLALLGEDARDALRKRQELQRALLDEEQIDVPREEFNDAPVEFEIQAKSEETSALDHRAKIKPKAQSLGYKSLPAGTKGSRKIPMSMSISFDPTMLESSFEESSSSSEEEEGPFSNGPADILRQASMAVVGKLKSEAKEENSFVNNLYDWNKVFQEKIRYLSLFRDNSDASVMEHIYTGLIRLGEDFIKSAKSYGRIIINERYLDNEFKTIKPVEMGGTLGGEKFRVHNILFKFAHDSTNLFRGSDEAAAKVAGHELKGLTAYFQRCNNRLHFPLMALIDYKGFRLVASSMLPLGEGSLLYGSADGGATVHMEDEELCKRVTETSARLNLKPHAVGKDGETIISSPADLEGHKGLDGRYYLLDFSRAMPPCTPDPRFPGSHLFRMFRQEFVASFPLMPLCSDAYSSFVTGQPDESDHRREIDTATQDLEGITLSNFARELATALAAEARANNTLAHFQLTQEVHRRGINVRYLGMLLTRMGLTPYAPFLLAHMCARLIKLDIRARLRERMSSLKLVVDEPYRVTVADFLNVVFSESSRSYRYWSQSIREKLNKKFNLRPENWLGFPDDLRATIWKGLVFRDGSRMDLRMYILDEVRQMTGMQITESLLKVLRAYPETWGQLKIFSDTDLLDLGDRVKMLDVISKAKGRVFTMRGEEKQRLRLLPSALELYRQALVAFEAALSSTPLNTDLLRSCAITMLRTAILEEALARDVQPEDVSYVSADKPILIRANQCFVRALQGDATNSFSHLSYAKFLVYTQQFETAEDHFLQALHYNPCMLKALTSYAEFLMVVRKDEQAANRFLERCEELRRYLTLHADELVVPDLGKRHSGRLVAGKITK